MKKKLFIAVCGLLVVVAAQAQPLLKTHVETGDVEGVLDGTDLAVYKAIPFAAPPVGELRWKAPQPAKPWEGVLKAEECAKWPPQPERDDVTYDMMSEDCLYLSVVTPAKSVTDALPVMVYIHGGSWKTEHYGGELWQSLARRGVVTVSIEYRAGALGFLAHPELSKESADGTSGNYGLLDQIFALQWIQRNIKNFGGDPSKVTIFGESAGAMNCNILCASPMAKGLFRACISQSGAFMSTMSMVTQQQAEMLGSMFVQQLQKNSIAELRAMDAKSLTGTGVNFMGCTPIIDGKVLTDEVYNLYELGQYTDVPVMLMYNSDEGAVVEIETAEQYKAQMNGLPQNYVDSVLAIYPADTDEQAYYSVRDVVRDLNFGWPAYAWARLQKKTGRSAVYSAYLAQKSDRTVYAKGNRRGAAHADDIMYLNGSFLKDAERYPQETAVSEIMQQYWVNFAKTMNPNGAGLPEWPVYEEGKKTVMQFNNGATLIETPNMVGIGLIDRFMQYVRKMKAEASGQ